MKGRTLNQTRDSSVSRRKTARDCERDPSRSDRPIIRSRVSGSQTSRSLRRRVSPCCTTPGHSVRGRRYPDWGATSARGTVWPHRRGTRCCAERSRRAKRIALNERVNGKS